MTGRPGRNQSSETRRGSKQYCAGSSNNDYNSTNPWLDSQSNANHWLDSQSNAPNGDVDDRYANYVTCPIQIPTNWDYQFFSKPWFRRSDIWGAQNHSNIHGASQRPWQLNNFEDKNPYRKDNRPLLPFPNQLQHCNVGRAYPTFPSQSSKQDGRKHGGNLAHEIGEKKGKLQKKLGVPKHSKRAQSPLPGSEEARKKEIAQAADKLKLCLMSFKDQKSEVLEDLLSKDDGRKQEEKSSAAVDSIRFVPELQLTPKDLRDIGKVNTSSITVDPQGNDSVEPAEDSPLEASDVMIVSESYGPTVLDTVDLDDSEEDISDDLYSCDGKEVVGLTETELQQLQTVQSALCNLEKDASNSSMLPEITVPVSSHVDYSQRQMTSSLCLPDLDFCSARLKEDLVSGITVNDANGSLCRDSICIKVESTDEVRPPPPPPSFEKNDAGQTFSEVQHSSQVLPRRIRHNSESFHNNLVEFQSSNANGTLPSASGRLRARSASLSVPETQIDVERKKTGSEGHVKKLKENVMRQLLSMSKARLKDIVTNPRSRKLEFVMKHLVKEHHMLLSRRLRLLAQARIRGLQGQENHDVLEDQENYPLDPDLDINLSTLPMEVIEQLGNIFNIDFRDCVDSADSFEKASALNFEENDCVSEGLEELQALQEVLCAENDIDDCAKETVDDRNNFSTAALYLNRNNCDEVDVTVKTEFDSDGYNQNETILHEKDVLKENSWVKSRGNEDSLKSPVLESHSSEKNLDYVVTRIGDMDSITAPSDSERTKERRVLNYSANLTSANIVNQLPRYEKGSRVTRSEQDVQSSSAELLGCSEFSGEKRKVSGVDSQHVQQQLTHSVVDFGFSKNTQAVSVGQDESMQQVPELENFGSLISGCSNDGAAAVSREQVVEREMVHLENQDSRSGSFEYLERQKNLQGSSIGTEARNDHSNSGGSLHNNIVCASGRQSIKNSKDCSDQHPSSIDVCTQTLGTDPDGDVQRALEILERSSRCPPQLIHILKKEILPDASLLEDTNQVAVKSRKYQCNTSRTSRGSGVLSSPRQRRQCRKRETDMFRFPNVHNLVGTESHHNIRVTATESENNILESNNCQSILACMFDIHKEMERLMKFHSQLSDRLQVVTSRSRFFSFADIEHSSSQLIGPNNCSDIRDEINTSDMEISSEMNFTCEDSQNQSSVGTLIACNSPVSVEKSDAEVHTPNSTEIRRDDDSVSEVQFNCSSLVEGTVREKSVQSHTSSITCDINERTRQDGNGIESNQGLVVETYENLPVSMTKVELINGNPCGMSVVGTINAAGSPKSLSEKSESEQNYCSTPSSRRASRNSGLKKSLSSRHSSQAGVESRSESLLEVNTSSRKVNYRRTRCHSEQNDSVSLSDGESESCHSESSLVISIARRSSRRRGSIRSKTLECSSRLNLDSQLKKLHNHSALAEETEDSKCNVSAICSDKLKMEPGDQPDFHKERWNQRQSRNRRCNSAGGLEHLGGEKIVVLKQEPDEEARSCHFSLNDVKMKEIEKDVEKNEKLNSAHMGNSTKTDEKCENDLTDNMCVLAAKGRGRQRKIARGVSFESSNSECLFSENGQNDSTQSHFNSQVIETQINTLNSDKIPINRLSSDDTCESDEISTKPNRRKRKRENSIKLEMEADSNTSDLKPGFALKKSRLHQDTDQVKELHSERNNSIDRKEELQGTSRSSLKVGCRPTRKRMRSNSDDSPVTHSFPNIRKCCVLLERLNLAELSGLRGNVLQTISEETSATSNKADNKLNLTELSGSRVNVLQTISEESLATSNKADNKLNLAELSGSRVNVLQTISEETSSTSDMADNKCSISERNSNENSTKLEKDITDTNENLDITKCEVLEKDFPMTNRRGISSPKSNLPISKIFEMLKSENASSPAHSDPTQEIESQLALLEEMSSHLAEHSDSQENLQSLGCDVEEDNLSSVSEREENSSKVTIACQDVSLGHQDQKTIFNDALLDENSVSTFVSDSSVVSDGEQMPMKTPRDSSVWFSSSPDDCDRDSVSSYEAMQENSEGSCKIKTSRKHKHIRKSETPEHMVFDSHIGSILDLKTFGRHILAACEDGKVYCYSLKSGRLKHVYDGHGDKVICLLVLGNSAKENDLKGKSGKMESDLVFTGSLDNHLRCFDFKTGALINKAVNVRSPVQCMDQNWGTIFIGTKTGKVARFSTKLFKLADNQMECSKTSVLALKATKEGPRNVLVVATSNEPLAIRDATTGLLLRSFGLPRTVFSLVLDSSFVYCGTKTGEVIVLPFTTGEEVCKMKSGNGVSCMKIYNNLLFAGCYDGYIYVYSLKSQTLICRIEGGKMMLCLDVMKNRIIAGSKSKLQTSIFPVEIRNFLKEEKYRSSHGENNSNVIHSKELPITGTKPKMGLIKS